VRRAETVVVGEYVTAAGRERRLVAVEREGGWCLLDMPAAHATSERFEVVRRLGDPADFGEVARAWIERAADSEDGPGWLARAVGDGDPTATVDIYSDRNGMRRLVVVEGGGCSHLVDVPVDPGGGPARLVAVDVSGVDEAVELGVFHVERALLLDAAVRAASAA
jgi:hypothetical protein